MNPTDRLAEALKLPKYTTKATLTLSPKELPKLEIERLLIGEDELPLVVDGVTQTVDECYWLKEKEPEPEVELDWREQFKAELTQKVLAVVDAAEEKLTEVHYHTRVQLDESWRATKTALLYAQDDLRVRLAWCMDPAFMCEVEAYARQVNSSNEPPSVRNILFKALALARARQSPGMWELLGDFR